jgi:hypothetical protein
LSTQYRSVHVGTYTHFCLRCGRAITKAIDIERGYGRGCWKIVKPKEIKPYVQEVPYVISGNYTRQTLLLDFMDFSKGDGY